MGLQQAYQPCSVRPPASVAPTDHWRLAPELAGDVTLRDARDGKPCPRTSHGHGEGRRSSGCGMRAMAPDPANSGHREASTPRNRATGAQAHGSASAARRSCWIRRPCKMVRPSPPPPRHGCSALRAARIPICPPAVAATDIGWRAAELAAGERAARCARSGSVRMCRNSGPNRRMRDGSSQKSPGGFSGRNRAIHFTSCPENRE
jgi:hypothetical protein